MQTRSALGSDAAQRARDTRSRIVSAELPPEQEERRGRWFIRIYTALIALTLVAFVLLALQVRGTDVLQFDLAIAHAIQAVHGPVYAWVLTHSSDLGFFPGTVISYAGMFCILLILGLRLDAALAVASSLLAALAGSEIRTYVERPRPSSSLVHVVGHVGGFSFPSGHVIQYVTLFGFAFYLVLIAWRSSLPRNVALAGLLVLVILVGPSRVYLGAHWPSDVLGAYLFGALWLAGTIELHLTLMRRLGNTWSPRLLRRRISGRSAS